MTCFCKLLISMIIHLHICIWNWPTFSIRFVYIHLFCDLKKNESKKIRQIKAVIAWVINEIILWKLKVLTSSSLFWRKQKTKLRQNATVKKRDKKWACFPTSSLLGFWRSVICCICQKFKCFRLLGILPKWESGLAGLQLCSWQKIFSFSRPA